MTCPVPRRRGIEPAAVLAALALLPGCSLLTIKSPEVPLTPREQEARLLTRDYAARFTAAFTQLLDDAQLAEPGPEVKIEALRLKLGGVLDITQASTGLSPTLSVIDTWAFSVQLRDYFVDGAGSQLLGKGLPGVRQGVTALAAEADSLAHQVSGADYTRYQAFVAAYAQRHPLTTVDLSRPSVLSDWSTYGSGTGAAGAGNPLREAGTVAQALGDVSDRLRIYGERVPPMTLWQAELALDRAGIDDAAYRDALRRADAQLERISRLADASPELVREAIGGLRASLRDTTRQLDASALQMLRSLRAEREALSADVATERAGVTASFDEQRAKLSADAAQIAQRAVDTSWRELRKLVRDALLLMMLLVLLLLGLPFAAGYAVGRRLGGARPPAAD